MYSFDDFTEAIDLASKTFSDWYALDVETSFESKPEIRSITGKKWKYGDIYYPKAAIYNGTIKVNDEEIPFRWCVVPENGYEENGEEINPMVDVIDERCYLMSFIVNEDIPMIFRREGLSDFVGGEMPRLMESHELRHLLLRVFLGRERIIDGFENDPYIVQKLEVLAGHEYPDDIYEKLRDEFSDIPLLLLGGDGNIAKYIDNGEIRPFPKMPYYFQAYELGKSIRNEGIGIQEFIDLSEDEFRDYVTNWFEEWSK